MNRTSGTSGAAPLAAIALIIGCGATAAQEPATAWWVDLDVDHAADTMGNVAPS